MDRLKALQATDKYLFHGSSSSDIAQLEPRQARTQGREDGDPCVAASEYYEPAVFKAVLGSRQLGGWTYDDDGNLLYFLLRSEYARAKDEAWTGYVYVLDRNSEIFTERKEWEWRAYTNVEPVDIVKVGMNNLPKNIILLDNYEQYYKMARKK